MMNHHLRIVVVEGTSAAIGDGQIGGLAKYVVHLLHPGALHEETPSTSDRIVLKLA